MCGSTILHVDLINFSVIFYSQRLIRSDELFRQAVVTHNRKLYNVHELLFSSPAQVNPDDNVKFYYYIGHSLGCMSTHYMGLIPIL